MKDLKELLKDLLESMDRDLNASINILNMGIIKIGEGIPEFTPVESATAAELSKGGLRVATL